jgi:hypothetical protein
MYCLLIQPEFERSDREVAALNNTHANDAHWDEPIEEDAFVVGPDGVIARLVTECLSKKLVSDTAEYFRTVRGDLSNAGKIVGKGSMMYRERKDHGFGSRLVVPKSIRKSMQARGTFRDHLGWWDKVGRTTVCRPTGWSLEDPDVHAAAAPLVREVSRIYREELPDHWLKQKMFIDRVRADFKFNESVYANITVNRNVRTTYHYDSGDYRGGMGNLVVLEGNETGELVMPRYRIKFRPRPTDVLLMNVHEMHGNLPIVGERLTAVLYAREHLDRC